MHDSPQPIFNTAGVFSVTPDPAEANNTSVETTMFGDPTC
jgi:hypothetical protein